MKLCIVYPFASHYRTAIFTNIDKNFDCEWYFGDSMFDVKKMDYSKLQNPVQELHRKRIKMFTYLSGEPTLLNKDFSHYLVLPDTHSISSWLFLILSRLHPRKKVYAWTHGWYGKESFFEKLLKKFLFRLPNGGVFLYGNYARELMIKEGFNPNKLFTIHNSLAYDQQLAIRKEMKETPVYTDHFGNENPNLFFVGRLTPVKKLDQILRAMVICKQNGHDYNMTFIGGGEKAEELQKLTNELGLQNNVWFYGPCYDEKELSNLIYNADLCVAPGNIGLTAMHSMVFGTPCITHNDFKWQMPEFEAIKEGMTGTFFKRDDVNDLSKVIDSWFASKCNSRKEVRVACMEEIDNEWTPQFQVNMFKKIMN